MELLTAMTTAMVKFRFWGINVGLWTIREDLGTLPVLEQHIATLYKLLDCEGGPTERKKIQELFARIRELRYQGLETTNLFIDAVLSKALSEGVEGDTAWLVEECLKTLDAVDAQHVFVPVMKLQFQKELTESEHRHALDAMEQLIRGGLDPDAKKNDERSPRQCFTESYPYALRMLEEVERRLLVEAARDQYVRSSPHNVEALWRVRRRA